MTAPVMGRISLIVQTAYNGGTFLGSCHPTGKDWETLEPWIPPAKDGGAHIARNGQAVREDACAPCITDEDLGR